MKLNNKNYSNMTIFDLLKQLKKHYWYDVPADIFATAYIKVDYTEAGKQLTHLRNHWAKQDVKTEFEFSEAIELPVWDSVKLEMVVKPVIKVRMINDRIKAFGGEI